MRTLQEEMRLKRESQRQQKGKADTHPSPERSMRLSVWEGSFFGVMSGFTDPFIVPFALLFNAPNIIVSILTTLPLLLGSVIQLFAPRLLAYLNSRRRYLILLLSIQATGWLFLPWVAAIPDKEAALYACVLLAVATVSISYAVSSVWLSYMGDLVPSRRRARYFSMRNGVIAAVTLVATLAAGFLLKGFTNLYLGFALLFVVASAARWLSASCFKRMAELPPRLPKPGTFSLTTFFHRAPRSDFGRFVTFTMLLRFAAYLAAPFFVVYQLKVLRLDYLSFTVLQAASIVGSVLALQAWAKVLEWQGTRRVLVASAVFIGIVPLLYLMSYPGMPFLLLFAFEVFSGVAWSGFNVATNNYALEATSQESRPYVLTYNSLLNNSALFLAGIAGGLLLTAMGGSGDVAAPFLALFAISGCLRLLVALGGSTRLKEISFVEVRFGEGVVSSYISILPRQGVVVLPSGAEPQEFRDEVEHGLEVRKNVEEQLKQLDEGETLVERMSPEERELYEKKYLEKVKRP
jgi:MFS family permease